MLWAFPSAVIENLQPLIDGGRYPIKRVTGEDLVVEADIFKEGHDVVAAALKWLAKRGNQLGSELIAGVLDGEPYALGTNAGRHPHAPLFGQVVDDRVVHEVRTQLQQERL